MRFCWLAVYLWQRAHDILDVERERYCTGKCGAAGCVIIIVWSVVAVDVGCRRNFPYYYYYYYL